MSLSLIHPRINVRAVADAAGLVLRHWELTRELARRDVLDRYLNQSLGAAWAFLNPILLIALYLVLFVVVFPARLGDGQSTWQAIVYILAGLVPWMSTADVMNRSVGVLRANASLVKQIVFPIEVLPVKTVLAAAIGLLVPIAPVVVLAFATASAPPWALPFLLLAALILHAVLMIGTATVLATVGTFFPDLSEFVSFFTGAGLFLAPILYLPERLETLPVFLKAAVAVNPFSHLIWCYQDALFFQSIQHPWSWVVTAALAMISVAWGFRLFQKMKPVFGEAL